MRTVIYSLLALCIIQVAFSQCSTGYIPHTSWDVTKALCAQCHPICKDCQSSTTNCLNYLDAVQGVDKTGGAPGVLICPQANRFGAAYGYNKQTDTCDECMTGCASCLIDYNICGTCKAGYDYDRINGQCIRATLGLAAVVLALSALILVVVIITCICACKL